MKLFLFDLATIWKVKNPPNMQILFYFYTMKHVFRDFFYHLLAGFKVIQSAALVKTKTCRPQTSRAHDEEEEEVEERSCSPKGAFLSVCVCVTKIKDGDHRPWVSFSQNMTAESKKTKPSAVMFAAPDRRKLVTTLSLCSVSHGPGRRGRHRDTHTSNFSHSPPISSPPRCLFWTA